METITTNDNTSKNIKGNSAPWEQILAHNILQPRLLSPEEQEAMVRGFADDLIKEGERFSGKVPVGEDYAILLDTLRAVMLNETFTFTDEDGTGYMWNVTAALDMIAASPRPTDRFAPMEQGVTLEHILYRYPTLDTERAMQTDLSVPLLFIPFGARSLMIDGWHRLFRAVSEGVEVLECYELTEEETAAILMRLDPPGG